MIKKDVGLEAGSLYSLLSDRGRLSLRKIEEITHKREASLFLSLGWLLRENKIHVFEQNGEWFFEIKATMSELYY